MRVISADEATRQIATETNAPLSPNGAVAPDLVIAEYIRQSLCDLTVSATPSRSAVYLSAVTNNVRRQLISVWPALERRPNKRPSQREQEAEGDLHPDPLRRVLEALDDLREIAHMGNGYYAPTPTRLVKLSDATALLVSGAPTATVRKEIGVPVAATWVARTVRWQDLSARVRSDEIRWQSTRAWLGSPPGNLESWTADLLSRAKRQLAASAASITEFEIYVPTANRTRPQAFRWISAKTFRGTTAGLVLCRASEGKYFGLRRYWLGTLRHSRGEWRADREYPVEHTHIRRLQYGLDRNHGVPTEVRLRQGGTTTQLTFTSLLPAEERRALVAFGIERSPKPGKLPVRYELAQAHVQFILPLLEQLEIAVVTEH